MQTRHPSSFNSHSLNLLNQILQLIIKLRGYLRSDVRIWSAQSAGLLGLPLITADILATSILNCNYDERGTASYGVLAVFVHKASTWGAHRSSMLHSVAAQLLQDTLFSAVRSLHLRRSCTTR